VQMRRGQRAEGVAQRVILDAARVHRTQRDLGAFLLDLANPTHVTHRTRRPIYEPVAAYETHGIYDGVCFPCGHALIDGTYFLYYGGADVTCNLATCRLDDLIASLLAQPITK